MSTDWIFCDFENCDYKSKFQGNMDKHKNIHKTKTGKIALCYKCSECGTKCQQKDYWKKHVKQQHNDSNDIKCILVCLDSESKNEIDEPTTMNISDVNRDVEMKKKAKCIGNSRWNG